MSDCQRCTDKDRLIDLIKDEKVFLLVELMGHASREELRRFKNRDQKLADFIVKVWAE